MGIVKKGILGGFSGKVGPVIGSSWKGIATVRSMPISVANPNTTGQQEQRGKLRTIAKVGSDLLGAVIQVLWNPIAKGISGYNLFVNKNIGAVNSSGILEGAQLMTTIGSLQPCNIDSVTADQSLNRVTIDWTDNSGTGNALSSDIVCAVAWNRDTDKFAFAVATATRADETVQITMPGMNVGNTVFGYLGFYRSGDPSTASDSTNQSTSVVP